MKFPRASGLLLHPTSLPGPYGLGDLGPLAHAWLDDLHRAGQKLWQVLPLGPTGYGDSPYQSFSAFAGNPLLLSLDLLRDQDLLTPSELAPPPFPASRVDFGWVLHWKLPLLALAARRFADRAGLRTPEFLQFSQNSSYWLPGYSRFMTAKQPYPPETHAFWQFEFHRQWHALKAHAHSLGIRIMGDMPIYVASDSADVADHPDLFRHDFVAGVPPDYFSSTGQLWGNPVYHWDTLRNTGYRWWIERFRHTLELVDLVRLDHFRGFQAFWQVPAGSETAIGGQWIPGPGAHFFKIVEEELDALPLLAENLGVITPEVELIRLHHGYPGMAILQFAFGNDPQGPSFRPHNFPRELVAYTGTHDNDTTLGWWNSQPDADSTRSAADIEKERAFAKAYLRTDGAHINWTLIETLLASVADTALIPLQDVLSLGAEARMNLPGRPDGNWQWRMPPNSFTPALQSKLRSLVELYDR